MQLSLMVMVITKCLNLVLMKIKTMMSQVMHGN